MISTNNHGDFAATGHAPSSKAIAEGLQARNKEQQKPAHWIQISGATLFAGDEISSGRFGYASDAVYDDVKNQSQILSIIRNNAKRIVENTVLAQKPEIVRTALIVGPLIYGPGRGPVGQRSIQAPEIAKATLQLGHGFKLNDGENIWSNVHVQDLSNLVSLLVKAAIEGKEGMWNEDGIYNVENGELVSLVRISCIWSSAKINLAVFQRSRCCHCERGAQTRLDQGRRRPGHN